jgi:hypothetical protein
MKGRAETDKQKKDVMDKLLKAWKASPLQRLGQLLSNATYSSHKGGLFQIEDEVLVDKVMEFVGPTLPTAHFQHDCEECIYLGQDKEHDFYFHSTANGWLPTVIARFGSDGPDYASGLEGAIQYEKNFPNDNEYPLVKALKLARQRGLIPVSKH